MMNINAELPGVGLKLQSKVSIHRLVSSVWNMKDVVSNESGETSESKQLDGKRLHLWSP